MRTARRLAAGVLSLVTLCALLVGVPVALTVFVGWPLPHSWPSMTQVRNVLETSGISDTLLIDTLALVCWIAWLDFAVATGVELVSAVSGRPSRRVPVVRAWQPAVARLITTIVLAWSAIGARPAPAAPPQGATLAVALAGRHAPSATGVFAVASGESHAAPVTTRPAPSPAGEYVVHRGDTLWGIAHGRLGDARRWTEIWRRNEDRQEPGGRRFTDPNLIVTGWRLDVPAESSPGHAPAPPPPAAPAPAPPPLDHAPPIPPMPSALAPATPDPSARVTPPPAGHAPQQAQAPSSARGGVDLPQGGLVGLGFAAGVLSSLAAARIHERRHRRIGQTSAGSAGSLAGPTVRQLQRACREAESGTGRRSAPHAEASPRRGILSDGQVPGRICIGVPPSAAADTGTQMLDNRTDIVELTGIAFVGEGAEAVLRALIAAMAGSDWREGAEVLLVGEVGRLLSGVTDLTGVCVVPDAGTGHREIRGGIERRLGTLRNQEAEDYRDLLDSMDPVGALLAVVDAEAVDADASAELAGIARESRRLGACIVALGEAAGFECVRVAADGTVIEAPDHIRHLIGRFFTLNPAEGREILTVISAGRDHPVLVEEPSPPDGVVDSHLDADMTGDAEVAEAEARPVRVRLFGRPRVEVDGDEVTTGVRESARELLCLLAMRPAGLRLDEGCTEMWPDDEDSHVDIFRVSVTSARRVLRDLTGVPDARFIVHEADRYALDRTVVDADVWQLDRALASMPAQPTMRRGAPPWSPSRRSSTASRSPELPTSGRSRCGSTSGGAPSTPWPSWLDCEPPTATMTLRLRHWSGRAPSTRTARTCTGG